MSEGAYRVVEDDAPKYLPSEKQQRLLTEPLYSSWRGPRPFLAAANVGIFPSVHTPPIVPDMFLSLGVEAPQDWWAKRHRTYFAWEFGKAPEVVMEIVSNREGDELTRKLDAYGRMGVAYYVVYDPQRLLQTEPVALYVRQGAAWNQAEDLRLEGVGLSLTLWRGTFEDREDEWLRWCDAAGELIPTGAERAEAERQRAEAERQRAEAERHRADEAERQVAALRARLRALGVEE